MIRQSYIDPEGKKNYILGNTTHILLSACSYLTKKPFGFHIIIDLLTIIQCISLPLNVYILSDLSTSFTKALKIHIHGHLYSFNVFHLECPILKYGSLTSNPFSSLITILI